MARNKNRAQQAAKKEDATPSAAANAEQNKTSDAAALVEELHAEIDKAAEEVARESGAASQNVSGETPSTTAETAALHADGAASQQEATIDERVERIEANRREEEQRREAVMSALKPQAGRAWLKARLAEAQLAEKLGPNGEGWKHNETKRERVFEHAEFLRALDTIVEMICEAQDAED